MTVLEEHNRESLNSRLEEAIQAEKSAAEAFRNMAEAAQQMKTGEDA